MGIWGNLIRGIESVEVRDMTMLVFRIITVPQPLLQLSVTSNLHGRQLLKGSTIDGSRIVADAQYLSGTHHLIQRIEHNLVVHRRTSRHGGILTHGAMLWRNSRHRDQPTKFRMNAHIVQQEVGSTLHHRIVVCQQLLVASKEILLPDMRRQPRTTRWEHSPRGTVDGSGNTPKVSIVMSHPTPATIHLLCSFDTRLAQVLNHCKQRLLVLNEVTNR